MRKSGSALRWAPHPRIAANALTKDELCSMVPWKELFALPDWGIGQKMKNYNEGRQIPLPKVARRLPQKD